MRIKNIFAAVLLAGICTSASAQFATQTSASAPTATNTPSEGWSSFYVQYNPGTVSPDEGEDLDFTGVSVGFNKYTSISQSAPLFLEYGAALQYSWNSEEEDDITTKYNMFSAKIPVNVTYAFAIPNSKITIAPYAGLNLRLNLFGNRKYEVDGLGSYEDEFWEEMEEEYGIKQEANLFDKDDMGHKDATWKRFQIGWQIGVNVNFQKAYLGVSYGSDFTEIVKDCKMKTTSITLGYKF